MPKASVILTSFNHEKYLREAIDSTLNQTFTDFELIIWDDASSDGSWNIINSYSDSRIKAFRNEETKRGIYGINKAISEVATGEFIAIHHSDDVWELDKLEKQVSFLEKHSETGAVFTNALAISEDTSLLDDESHFYFKIFDQPNRTRHEWLNHFFNHGNALCHPSVLIRKSCYEDCGLYRSGLAQVGDFDMWIRLCLKYEIHVLPEKLIRFRVRDNEKNASGNRPETRIRGQYEMYKLLQNYRQLKNFDDLVKVFPTAEKFFRKNKTDMDFTLAMIVLEEKPFTFTALFGLELLFEAISDSKRAKKIKRAYDFDYKNFIALTGKLDVFSREELSNASLTIIKRDSYISELEFMLNKKSKGNLLHGKFKILLVSYYCPSRVHAGGLRILDIYSLIRKNCPNIELNLLTYARPSFDGDIKELSDIFDNIYFSPTQEITPEILHELTGKLIFYNLIDLQFHQMGFQIDYFKKICAKLIFTPMESQIRIVFILLESYLRRVQKFSFRNLISSLRLALEEVIFAFKANAVVCVSDTDASATKLVSFSSSIKSLNTGVSGFEFYDALIKEYKQIRAADRRCNVLYLAFFGSNTNLMALRWYLDNVHPIIKANVPDYVLTIVGKGDLTAFESYQDKSIEFIGEVNEISPYIQNSRVGIAPALSGSGFRGKVNQYSIFGVPSVISRISSHGLAYKDSEHIFITEIPEVFANKCIQLLVDLELNDRMGLAARELCLTKYTWEAMWPSIYEIYNLKDHK